MTVDHLACSVHTDRPAEGRCERCGRPACLACAIPVRGQLVCREDALEEIGELAQDAAPALPSRPGGRERLVVAGLVVAVGATAAPWHRFGILTSILSAWTPQAGWWAPAACTLIAVSAAAATWRLRQGGSLRPPALLAAAGSLATVIAMVADPPFVSHSPAPFVALSGATTAAIMGTLGLRRP